MDQRISFHHIRDCGVSIQIRGIDRRCLQRKWPKRYLTCQQPRCLKNTKQASTRSTRLMSEEARDKVCRALKENVTVQHRRKQAGPRLVRRAQPLPELCLGVMGHDREGNDSEGCVVHTMARVGLHGYIYIYIYIKNPIT